MMRFAYLVHAHRDVEQIEALVARLLRDDPGDIVILHVDRRSPITDAELDALAARHANLRITPRVKCHWGHPSLCEAMLVLMQSLANVEYDVAHLLSGQDWPTCDKVAMCADIEPGACYISLRSSKMADRMNDFHFHNRLLTPTASSFPARGLRKLLSLAGEAWSNVTRLSGRSRTCPLGRDWERGPAWWSLPCDAVDYLADNMARMLRSGRLRHTLCSDEHVPHTILAYSRFAGLVRPNRRFMVWNGGPSPAMLGAGDLPAIERSQSWFARKVSLAHDPFFLEL